MAPVTAYAVEAPTDGSPTPCVFCVARVGHDEHVHSDRVRVAQDFGEADTCDGPE